MPMVARPQNTLSCVAINQPYPIWIQGHPVSALVGQICKRRLTDSSGPDQPHTLRADYSPVELQSRSWANITPRSRSVWIASQFS